MAAPIQYERRSFEQGLVESISEYAKVNSFRGAVETWLIPGYEGVLGEFGPTVNKEDEAVTTKVVSGVAARDSSGNYLTVVHDIASGTVEKLSSGVIATGANLPLKSSTSTTTPMSFLVYNDKILCFDGSTTPFQIDISIGDSTGVSNIGVTQPTVTNASASIVSGDPAGNVKGTVKYYIAEMSATVEGALSVAFGTVDAGSVNDGAGTQILIDLSHADFVRDSGSDAATHAGTELSDTVKTTTWTDGADQVSVGDIVVNVTDGSQGVVTVVADTTLTHTQLAGGTDNSWDAGDDWRVAPAYRLYRTYANREAPNFASEIAGGGTYTDNFIDDDLGDLPRLHGDPPPAAITAAAVYNDVVYGLAGTTLYWSDPGEEESWWTATDGNSINLGDEGGLGKALYVEQDGVVAFQENDIKKLLGTSPMDFRLIPAVSADNKAAKVGTPASNSMASIPGGAFFYHDNKFHVYSNGRVVSASDAIDRLFYTSGAFTANLLVSPVVGYDPRFGVVYCGLSVSSDPLAQASTAGLILAFDAKGGRWRGVGPKTTRVPSGFLYDGLGTMYGFIYTDEIPGAGYECNSLVDGQVLDTVTDSALETTTGAEFQVPRFYGNSEFNEKRFVRVEVESCGSASADGTMKLQYSINGAAFATAGTATLSATRNKYPFNIGEYGREMDIKLTFTKGFRVFGITTSFQEFPSKTI